jgi:hypothetical protein
MAGIYPFKNLATVLYRERIGQIAFWRQHRFFAFYGWKTGRFRAELAMKIKFDAAADTFGDF